jgi:hypothetical protein
MSLPTLQYPDANSKRKFADLNKSNSSEDSVSPTTKPVCKAQKYHNSSMSLTKEDLVQLRKDFQSDIKVELKEQLAQCLSPLMAKVSKLENSVENLDQKFRAKNLILHGIQPLASETNASLAILLDNLWIKFGLTQPIILDDVYRLGNNSIPGARPLLVKFLRTLDKKQVLLQRKEAAKYKIFMSDDCTPLQQFQKKLLNTHLKSFKETDSSVWGSIRGNSLHIKKTGHPMRKFIVEAGAVRELSP